jgi:pilus assembly protein CpaF
VQPHDAAELELSIELADGRSQTLNLPAAGPVWLGRDPNCHVVLNSPTVSRTHVAIERRDFGLWVRDMSNNGTLVGDSVLRQEERLVLPGTVMRIGPYAIRIGAAAQPAPLPTAVLAPEPEPITAEEAVPASVVTPLPRPTPPGAAAAAPASAFAAIPPGASVAGSPTAFAVTPLRARDVTVERRRFIHRRLLDSLDLDQLDRKNLDPLEMRPKVLKALRRITAELADELPRGEQLEVLIKELCDESLGLGPLEDLLADPNVSEIMVVDPHTIFAEIKGCIQETPYRFTDNESVRAAIERIVTPLGRRIDESSPLVDARLRDGSRVNAVIPPLAIKGPCITIRKFARDRLTMERCVEYGSLTPRMARFLERCVKVRKNIVISGGTGSGKTTLLNILSASIPEEERVVTIEDAAELQLRQTHVVSLESRPANMEGKGAYTIRDLVKNALRMRPDRIVVGECRGGEAIDMLQAMNTGHDGSMTTTHANSPREALSRLETLCLMSGLDLPVRAIRSQIASSVDVVIQQTRLSDGSRRITSITEVCDVNEDGDIDCYEIFDFHRTATRPGGKIVGEFRATGYVPTFVDQFIAHGLCDEGEYL